TMFLKDRTAPPPSLLTDRAAVRGAGKNALILTGKRIRRLPSGALVAESVRMTPCDCAAEPDFELDSPEVEVEGDRARLSSPHLGAPRRRGAAPPAALAPAGGAPVGPPVPAAAVHRPDRLRDRGPSLPDPGPQLRRHDRARHLHRHRRRERGGEGARPRRRL